MIYKGIITLLVVSVLLCAHGVTAESGLSVESGPSVQLRDSRPALMIKKRIGEWKGPFKAFIGREQIYAAVLVGNFYKRRNYQPAWIADGHIVQADKLIKAVEDAYGDGLTPDYYHLVLLKSLVAAGEKGLSRDPSRLADFDILLTDTFLTLGCHLSAGCVNPVTIEPEWYAKSPNLDVSSVLEQALARKQIRDALAGLRPAQEPYLRLRKALASYRELASKGQWPPVSNGPVLKKDCTSYRVVELRKRLSASGDLAAGEVNGGDRFDDKLEQSVIIFQKRHGLKADGIVGPATLEALNVPLEQRIRQIELNMERLRWTQVDADRRSIVINIADFELDVMEDGKSILSMKAVVGKPYRSTPVFTAKMTYLVINPRWNVPDSIARKELLKTIRHNPHYLAEQNIDVLKNSGNREEEINPGTINWWAINEKNLRYRFRQEPGPQNALGRLKFMFPNKYNVYLHDTPARQLFSENVRAFSHGCTRIEKPIELAKYLLQDAPGWTQDNLMTAIEEGAEKTVLIPNPINVYFFYLTAWVDEAGTLQFRNDIYKRDAHLDQALRKKLPLQ